MSLDIEEDSSVVRVLVKHVLGLQFVVRYYLRYVITGSAVTCTVVRPMQKSIGKMGNSTPCKIVTLKISF